MKKALLYLTTIFSISILFAQEVQQNILVEHYTNTRCGICSSRNPAMFSLLENYNEVHIAYYPSEPYSSCIFSQHNATEADARTNYYGIYGGTPRVVLNGEVVPASSTLLQESRINQEVSNTSAFMLEVSQDYINNNTVRVSISISTKANTNTSSLNLHAMLVESTINYDAPNGENTHYNVFRKALYGSGGQSITIPANGSSETYEVDYTIDLDWVEDNMQVVVFLQDDNDKSVKQANKSERLGGTTNINALGDNDFEIYPNPAKEFLFVSNKLDDSSIKIYNTIGKEVKNEIIESTQIDISDLEKGIYFIQIKKEDKLFTKQFFKI